MWDLLQSPSLPNIVLLCLPIIAVILENCNTVKLGVNDATQINPVIKTNPGKNKHIMPVLSCSSRLIAKNDEYEFTSRTKACQA